VVESERGGVSKYYSPRPPCLARADADAAAARLASQVAGPRFDWEREFPCSAGSTVQGRSPGSKDGAGRLTN
jgi:hypothetical protein